MRFYDPSVSRLRGSCYEVTERVKKPSPPSAAALGTSPIGRGKNLIRHGYTVPPSPPREGWGTDSLACNDNFNSGAAIQCMISCRESGVFENRGNLAVWKEKYEIVG